jgi:hypothetical protein
MRFSRPIWQAKKGAKMLNLDKRNDSIFLCLSSPLFLLASVAVLKNWERQGGPDGCSGEIDFVCSAKTAKII